MEQLKRYSFWVLMLGLVTRCSYCGKPQSEVSKKVAFFQKFQSSASSTEAKYVTLPPRYGGVSQDDGEFWVAGKKIGLVCQPRILKKMPQQYDQAPIFKSVDGCTSISRESSSLESSCAVTPFECENRASTPKGLSAIEEDRGLIISKVPGVEKNTSQVLSKSGLKRSPSSHNLLRDSLESGSSDTSISKKTSSSESSRSQSPENVPLSVVSTLVTAAFKKPRRAAQGLTVTIPEKKVAEDKPILLSRVVSSFTTLHCNPCS